MSDDSIALEVEEEVNIMDLVAEQGDETHDEDEEVETLDEMPDDAEGLKALLLKEREIKSKRNKSLKKSKQANHRLQDEADDLRKRMDEIEGRINTSSQPDQQLEAAKREQEAQEWADRVADDPSKAIDYANWLVKQQEDKVVNYFAMQQEKFNAQLAELKGSTNPEKLKYQAQIDKLKSNPAFAELDDTTLLTMVKGLSSSVVKAPRGSIGGGKVVEQPTNDSILKELKADYGRMFENGN